MLNVHIKRTIGNPGVPAQQLLEVVTPRTNAARLSSAEHLFGALVPRGERAPEPVSLEIVGDAEKRRFLARATSADELRRVAGQLGAAYPQAVLRPPRFPMRLGRRLVLESEV